MAKKSKGRILEGIVVSDKMNKTVVVKVVMRKSHAFYKKSTINRKKFKVHDEKETAKDGDRVKIIECSPYSKEKSFKLLQVVK